MTTLAMMAFEQVGTALINEEDLPWIPFTPYSDRIQIKLLRADPVRGETIALLKGPGGASLARHHHTGMAIVYTIRGAWRYREHDWVATPGSVVYETAATSHMPEFVDSHGDEVVTLNITCGELLYFDDSGNFLALENWRTAVQRYLDYCRDQDIEARDVTGFSGWRPES